MTSPLFDHRPARASVISRHSHALVSRQLHPVQPKSRAQPEIYRGTRASVFSNFSPDRGIVVRSLLAHVMPLLKCGRRRSRRPHPSIVHRISRIVTHKSDNHKPQCRWLPPRQSHTDTVCCFQFDLYLIASAASAVAVVELFGHTRLGSHFGLSFVLGESSAAGGIGSLC